MSEITTRIAKTLMVAIGLTGLLAISVTAGAVAGKAALDVVAPPEAQAHETCEQDECDRYRPLWPFWERRGRCVDNPGQDTGCEVTGKHACRTYACFPSGGRDDPGEE